MKIAVLSNEKAGSGRQKELLDRLCRLLSAHRLVGAEGYGGELLPERVNPGPAESYTGRLTAAVKALSAEGPELLITVGGDGTAAYTADALKSLGADLPLVGIGAGTANVGPIVRQDVWERLADPEQLSFRRAGAIEALTAEGRHLAYGFNDLILGNTFLGTLEGRTVTLDAAALAGEGRTVTARPLKNLGGPDFRLEKNGRPMKAPHFPLSQIIASPVEQDNYYGRAVAGLLCYTPDSPYRGAVLFSPLPLVSFEESPAGFEEIGWYGHLLLQPGDTLRISGLVPGVSVIADGNPYLLSSDTVLLRYVPQLISILA